MKFWPRADSIKNIFHVKFLYADLEGSDWLENINWPIRMPSEAWILRAEFKTNCSQFTVRPNVIMNLVTLPVNGFSRSKNVLQRLRRRVNEDAMLLPKAGKSTWVHLGHWVKIKNEFLGLSYLLASWWVRFNSRRIIKNLNGLDVGHLATKMLRSFDGQYHRW